MALPTTSTTLDSFFSSTITKFEKGLAKNFIEHRPILNVLLDNYSHKSSGSYQVQVPLEYGQNNNTKFFNPYDQVDTTPTETATAAIYPWRQIASSAAISQVEVISNIGKEAIFDLFESRIRQAIRSISNLVGAECYSDGSSFGNGSFSGLAAGISTTPTVNPAPGALGGVDAATNTWWRNNATTSAGSWAANGVNGTAQDLVIAGYNNATDGTMDKPTHIFSGQDVYQYYHRTLLGTVRYVDPSQRGTGDLSFGALQYQDTPWYWDRQCPAGRQYMLNVNHVHFYVDPQMFFSWSEPRTWPNQFVTIRLVALRLALVWKSRMFHTVIDGWTA